jgi:hypothetical protein
VIAAALIGAIALAGTLTGALIWQAMRAASSADAKIKMLKEQHRLARQVDAQGRALEDHGNAVRSLESTLAREKARSAALLSQLTEAHELLSQVKPDEVSHSIRGALERYRNLRAGVLPLPEAGET